MDLGLDGVPAVVLASSRGLGLAAAKALIDEGARVLLTARDDETLSQSAAAVGAAGYVPGDTSDPAFFSRLVETAESTIGGTQILVVNCGGPPVGALTDVDEPAWNAGHDLVLMTLLRAFRAFVPLLERNMWARILVIGASGYREPEETLVISDAYRAAAVVLAKVMSGRLITKGITVNTVAPGLFDTARLRALGPDVVDRMAKSTPTGRLGDPAEFGALCAFLCSRWAGYLTGQTIVIDGGALRGV